MFHYTAYDRSKEERSRYKKYKQIRIFPEFTWSVWEGLQKFSVSINVDASRSELRARQIQSTSASHSKARLGA
jgi:hypothetical protein